MPSAALSSPVEPHLPPAVWQQSHHPSVYPTYFPANYQSPLVDSQQSQQQQQQLAAFSYYSDLSSATTFPSTSQQMFTSAAPPTAQGFNSQACYSQPPPPNFISEATAYPQLQGTYPPATVSVCQPNQVRLNPLAYISYRCY